MEKRETRRFPTDLVAECRTLGRSWTTHLRNISTSGCMVSCEEGALAEKDLLRICVKGLAAIDAEVVWKHRNHAGIRFRVPLHPAAMEHLGFELPDGTWGNVPSVARERPPVTPGLNGAIVKRIDQPAALEG
ncbi:MAG TPA: PilZ domain-containing protein [Croceibacterium sp.]